MTPVTPAIRTGAPRYRAFLNENLNATHHEKRAHAFHDAAPLHILSQSAVIAARGLNLRAGMQHETVRARLDPIILPAEIHDPAQPVHRVWHSDHDTYHYALGPVLETAGFSDKGLAATASQDVSNDDRMGIRATHASLITLLADGVGSTEHPAQASYDTIRVALDQLARGRSLEAALDHASRFLDQSLPKGDDSSTTFTAAHFFESEGANFFQQAAVGNSSGLLLVRNQIGFPWQEVTRTANDTLVQMIQDVSLVLTAAFDGTKESANAKKTALSAWRIAMRSLHKSLLKRDAALAHQTQSYIDEVNAWVRTQDVPVIPRAHARFARWHKAGLFVFSEREQRRHRLKSMILSTFDRNSHKSLLPSFSEPLLLTSGATYLHIQASDGLWGYFDAQEIAELINGLDHAIDVVNVLAAASFLAMHDHVLSFELRNLLRKEKLLLASEPRLKQLLIRNEREYDTAINQIMKRLLGVDNLTVQATMIRP